MTADLIQPVASLLGLVVWSYALAVAAPRWRVIAFVIWAICLAYAIQSLYYLDALFGPVASAVAFLVRVGLVVGGVGMVAYWHRRRAVVS